MPIQNFANAMGKNESGKVLFIPNMPDKLKEDLISISKNMGITLSQFLKMKLREIRDSYPEHMRTFREDSKE